MAEKEIFSHKTAFLFAEALAFFNKEFNDVMM